MSVIDHLDAIIRALSLYIIPLLSFATLLHYSFFLAAGILQFSTFFLRTDFFFFSSPSSVLFDCIEVVRDSEAF